MFWCSVITGQNIKVTGVVLDANSEPVIGASVLEKGTTNGVITDLNGYFHYLWVRILLWLCLISGM